MFRDRQLFTGSNYPTGSSGCICAAITNIKDDSSNFSPLKKYSKQGTLKSFYEENESMENLKILSKLQHKNI